MTGYYNLAKITDSNKFVMGFQAITVGTTTFSDASATPSIILKYPDVYCSYMSWVTGTPVADTAVYITIDAASASTGSSFTYTLTSISQTNNIYEISSTSPSALLSSYSTYS